MDAVQTEIYITEGIPANIRQLGFTALSHVGQGMGEVMSLEGDESDSERLEKRFQWSIQRSIKIKSLPQLVSELIRIPGPVRPRELEDKFNLRFGLVKTVGVVPNQRPFMRTMDFLKNDLLLLNDDYTLRAGSVDSDGPDRILRTIYDHAMENLIPFRMMMRLFEIDTRDVHPWNDFKETLSRELILEAKTKFPHAFKEKGKKLDKQDHPRGIYGWTMEDNSLNRLVELGMLFGICSFVVGKHVRFVSMFENANKRLVDFDGLVGLLKDKLNNFGPDKIITFDEILEVTGQQGIPQGVAEDAIMSGRKMITGFSGGREGASYINISGKKCYNIRFNEGCF